MAPAASPEIGGAESLNVLIVDSNEANLNLLKGHFEGLGQTNVLTAKTADEARKIMEERARDDRQRIQILLANIRLQEEDDGAKLINATERGEVYAVAMGNAGTTLETVASAFPRADDFLVLRDDGEGYRQRIGEIMEEAEKTIAVRRHAIAETVKPPPAQASADQISAVPASEEGSASPAAAPFLPGAEIISGEDAQCIYELLPSLPDFRKPESASGDAFVALWDMCGTLTPEFVMGRLANDLENHPKYSSQLTEILMKIPPNLRKSKIETLKRLNGIIKKANKGVYVINDKGDIGTYEEAIKYMNRLYVLFISGLPVRKMCAIGTEWSREDARMHLFPYVKPAMDMLSYLGISSTLITGAPAEAVTGYREALGIKERCHFLEAETEKREDGELVYANAVKEHGGLKDSKEKTAEDIARYHTILASFGNQLSDLEMGVVGMEPKSPGKFSPCGKYFHVMPENSTERPRHTLAMDSYYLRRNHIRLIAGCDGSEQPVYPILEEIALQLFRIERRYQYVKLGEDKNEAVENFRDKLHGLLMHPHGKPEGTPIHHPPEKRGFHYFIPDEFDKD